MRSLLLAAVFSMALTATAAGQPAAGWKDYAYPELGFLIQFPTPPTVSTATWPAQGGRTVPATVYAAREPGATFRVTVADFSGAFEDRVAVMAAAVGSARDGSEVKLELEAHVDLQFGRQLSLAGKDGSLANVVVFMLGRRLYVVEGRALPPDAGDRTDRIVRFVETLSFPDQPAAPR